MSSNFEEINCRRKHGSVKWDRFQKQCECIDDAIIPFTLADCDFALPETLREGLKNYLDSMVFGYTSPTEGYYEAVKSWFSRRHNWDIDISSILHSPGVLPAISNSIQAFTSEEDAVAILTPVYYPFKRIISSLNRTVVEVPLSYENGRYTLNERDFEISLTNSKTRILILCSPHNPIGKVWTRKELEHIVSVCKSNDILIIADEIHHDLIMPGFQHICLPTVNDDANKRTILLTSTSKSFNLAGLRTSMVIIENDELRKRYVDFATQNEFGILSVNAFGLKATEIAYNECESWLNEFTNHIYENHLLVKKFFEDNCPDIYALPLEGTYLQWIDFTKINLSEPELVQKLEKGANVYCDHGIQFGSNGEKFFRMNLAYPREIIQSALDRLLLEFQK